ncbi:unnamed protein product [Blepharisma stoltei]|uniref:DUF4378 domain-containing protein n=1 Tax=Blepharisma stoltei TaxID=1481888 RepID=A0AAU9JCC6_9CILI|nr:unnamed protein product [Blepharisma stoltei]
MALQLGFTWNEEPITFKHQPTVSQPIVNQKEIFTLPEQLDFKASDPPMIGIEKPQPMKFSNKPPSPKKLIQYQGLTKKKSWNGPQANVIKKPKFSNFTNLSKDKLKLLGKKKEVKSHPKVAIKPQWNDNTGTAGLFDPVISKKIPIEIKHAMNKNKLDVSKEKITPPTVFQAWDEVPRTQSKPSKPPAHKKQVDPILRQKEILIKENLDIRFFEDNENIIKKLEQELNHEKKARRQLDSQFSEKMKELERFKALDQQIKVAKEQYIKKNKQPSPENVRSTSVGRATEPLVKKIQPGIVQKPNIKEDVRLIRPKTEPPTLKKVTSEQLLSQIDVMKESLNEDEIILDKNGGNMFEIPTRDTNKNKPMIIKPPKDWNRAKSTTPELHNAKTSTKQESTLQIIEQSESFAAPVQRFEITEVRSKMDPLLNALSSTITRLNRSEKYGAHSGIGLISRVSAKYIAYYADSLSDLIIDDILIDTVHELQSIENRVSNKNIKEFKSESEKFVEELVKDFHEETKALQEKYAKPIEKRKELVKDAEDEVEILIEKPKRFWTINVDEMIIKSIKNYRREMKNYLEIYGGGSEGKLWEIYGFIGDEFVEEAVDSVLNDYLGVLDEFTDKVIGQEFM